MIVEILNPDNSLFKGEADLVTLPGTSGSFQIKNNHAPLISNLKEGTLTVHNSSETKSFEIKGGLVEVIHNKVTVLV
jgi:F-type H+-transporting ATPase subunit epsilon